ncbi:MAG: isoaspartyl peptidase/L-asparaginase [Kofleriaceae bacterium]|nr:isoaspartyl peptidase/L-asparaginase [Kofleriaceae bacterium]MCB9571074.1 isoaspartyl peptidase/L-asparaginase [Kofleriaceae bacterium]
MIAPLVVVHGGAGRIAAERQPRIALACRDAARCGLDVLRGGGAVLDAVQAAARVLEDCPELNAGVGAVLSREGTVELDAALMDGATRRIGAIAAVPDLRQPIDLARRVLDDGEHVLLAGPAAWAFAAEHGIAPVDPARLITLRSRARLAEERARRAGVVAPIESLEPTEPAVGDDREHEGGTIGAVAVDAAGRVAAATSTGGIAYKRPGRVGDTPLPGCGTWADDHAAASATGDGEAIIRVTLTRVVADRIAAGASPADAARGAVAELARFGGSGGVICVDRAGRMAAWHDTDTMPVAAATLIDGEVRTAAWAAPRTIDDLAAALAAAPA